jgi:lysophospholipase L1-like esterase
MSWTSRGRALAANTLLVFLSVTVACLCLEGLTRVLVDESLWRFRDATDDWMFDPEIGWRQKPNLDVRSTFEGQLIRYRTDDHGVQVAGNADAAIRLLIVGDSTVAGRAVREGSRLQNQIAKQLKDRYGFDAYVVNAGVQGYSTDQSLLLLQKLIREYRPTHVVHMICDNDFLQNQSHFAYGLTKPMYTIPAEELLYEPPPPSSRSISRFGGWRSQLLQSSALYRVIQPVLVNLRRSLGLKRSLAEAPTGEAPTDFQTVDWKLFSALVSRMKSTSESNGAAFVLTKHPSLEEVWLPYRRSLGIKDAEALKLENVVSKLANQAGIDYVSFIEPFLNQQQLGPFHLLPGDPHANERGYELEGKLIADFVATHGATASRALR